MPGPDQRGDAQLGPGREDERLAGHAHRGDASIAGLRRGPGRYRVERVAQGQQARRAEGVRPGVVVAVVQGDEGHGPGPVGQRHVADQGPGDDLIREQRGQVGVGEDVRH
jgi:hypothetical protein